ncbi:hypothetical protein ACH5RR_014087 [Cinchona calisaya]|uniref:Uncharacterized protein n=1 Tax=Cinchona calisaya TaxID=153742 RepID=A0ABD3A5A5_9GENT
MLPISLKLESLHFSQMLTARASTHLSQSHGTRKHHISFIQTPVLQIGQCLPLIRIPFSCRLQHVKNFIIMTLILTMDAQLNREIICTMERFSHRPTQADGEGRLLTCLYLEYYILVSSVQEAGMVCEFLNLLEDSYCPLMYATSIECVFQFHTLLLSGSL